MPEIHFERSAGVPPAAATGAKIDGETFQDADVPSSAAAETAALRGVLGRTALPCPFKRHPPEPVAARGEPDERVLE